MNTLLRESKKYFTCFQQSNVWSYYGLRRATIPTFYIRGITSASSKSHVASSEKAVEEENINNDLDFGDFKKAFMAKSTFEIVRALSVYKLCSFNALVEHNRSVSSSYFRTLNHNRLVKYFLIYFNNILCLHSPPHAFFRM